MGSANASSSMSIGSYDGPTDIEELAFPEQHFTFLAWLYRPTKHFEWYFASVATPNASLPISLLSLTRDAHSLTFLSTSRVEAA